MTDLDLTPYQNEDLARLAQEAKDARARAAKRAQRYVDGKLVDPHKEDVSPQEYLTRLQRSMKRDSVLVKDVKQERIKSSLSDWKRKVGKTFAEATTDNPQVIERVSRIGTNGGHKTSLLFQGNLGVGKTWTAYAYINLAIASGAVTAGQIIADTETSILSKIASSGFKRSDLLEELLNPRYQIYFIDDVGQGYFSREEGRTEVWYELIDHVYSHQLTLIMTTNLPLTDNGLGRWVGGRAYDRLKTLVGKDGIMEPGKVNRRESVMEKREQEYRGQGNLGRSTGRSPSALPPRG